MTFIANEQPELVAPALEMDVGGIVCGHSQRADVVLPAAEQADLSPESVLQLAVPLIQEVYGRRDHESGPGDLFNRQHGQKRLASTGRQHDDASATVPRPRFETFDLMGKRVAVGS